MSEQKVFSINDLKRFSALEGKVLKDVIYYVWINRFPKSSPLVFIDKLQFIFADESVVTLTAGDQSDALYFLDDFDLKREAELLEQEFNGEITLKAHSAINDRFWAGLNDKKITSVRLSKQQNEYLADAVVFDLEGDLRLVGVSPEEGVLIDFYEDI